jgi:hypothetical protein
MYRAKHYEDEILVQEAREQLLEGADEDCADMMLESMSDAGMFRVGEL